MAYCEVSVSGFLCTHKCSGECVYVVAEFYSWFNFYFSLFFFMLIYGNEYETKENKN